jgi:hypothetical protein
LSIALMIPIARTCWPSTSVVSSLTGGTACIRLRCRRGLIA